MYQTFSVYSFAKNGYPYAAAETKRFLMTCSHKTMWVGILKKNYDSDLHRIFPDRRICRAVVLRQPW